MKEKNWYQKSLTNTFLVMMLAILTGIIINLLTNSFPTNLYLLLISIASILLFVLCAIASLFLIIIRNKIDNLLANKTVDNERAEAKNKLSPITLWQNTLGELHDKQLTKYKFWKWLGIISLILGMVAIIYVNVKSRTENIKFEYKIYENSSTIVDSIDNLNRRFDQQNVLILQVTDSIQSIKKEIQIPKVIRVEKEKSTNR